MANGPEKQFENRVKAYLKAHGAWFVKYWGGGPFTTSGIPDILVCWRGRFVAIETKSAIGEPTALQIWTINKINAAGGLAYVVYPDEVLDKHLANMRAKCAYVCRWKEFCVILS